MDSKRQDQVNISEKAEFLIDSTIHTVSTEPIPEYQKEIPKEIPKESKESDPLFTCGLSDKQQWILFFCVLAVLATVIPILSIRNSITSEFKANNLIHGKINPLNPPSTFDGVLIFANVTRIEHHNLSCTIRFSFFPVGTYLSNRTDQFGKDVKFYSERYHATIRTNEIDPVAEVTYPIVGLPVKYPFETYWTDFPISMYTIDDQPVPVALGMIASKQSWWGTAEILDIKDQIIVYVHFDQGWMTKLYAIFSSITMWVLTITMICITWIIFDNKATAERSMLRLAMRFLMAFPAIRRNQPQVVPMGSTEDIMSFFWCMGLMSFCLYYLVGNVVMHYFDEEITDDKKMFLPEKVVDGEGNAGGGALEVVLEKPVGALIEEKTFENPAEEKPVEGFAPKESTITHCILVKDTPVEEFIAEEPAEDLVAKPVEDLSPEKPIDEPSIEIPPAKLTEYKPVGSFEEPVDLIPEKPNEESIEKPSEDSTPEKPKDE